MKYKIITEELMKNLIDFLDEVQFDAVTDGNNAESMQKVNFCSYAIKELLNSNIFVFSSSPISCRKRDVLTLPIFLFLQ